MPGRKLLTESEALGAGFDRPDMVRRREVLRETLEAFESAPEGHYHALALANLGAWRGSAPDSAPRGEVVVRPDDWGLATQELTKRYGECFAVLNMANAHVPGGGYVEGMAAQEENMFRRTDCHFAIDRHQMDHLADRYKPRMTSLIEAEDGRVYLDTQNPRVCIRGPEDRSAADLGYRWLADDEVFPFYELRAAAVDLRYRRQDFDADEARRRIRAQLVTLIEAGIEYAVLSAFGCGAFANPADTVARLYREELDARRDHFALVAFAVFHPGYGPDNYTPFAEAFA